MDYLLIFVGLAFLAMVVRLLLFGLGAALSGIADAIRPLTRSSRAHARLLAEHDEWRRLNPEAAAYADLHLLHDEVNWDAMHEDD